MCILRHTPTAYALVGPEGLRHAPRVLTARAPLPTLPHVSLVCRGSLQLEAAPVRIVNLAQLGA